MTSGNRSKTLDAGYGLLSDSRRRYVLYHFVSNEIGHVGAFSRKIAAHERDVPYESVDEAIREDVAASLLHNHLPRLADHDVVEYDTRSGDVVRSDGFADLRPLVERARGAEADEASRDGRRPSNR